MQARARKIQGTNQFFGNLAYQRATTEATNLFGFKDATDTSGLDTAVNWSRRLPDPVGHELSFHSFQVRIQPPGNGRDAVLRESHQRVRRGRHFGQ